MDRVFVRAAIKSAAKRKRTDGPKAQVCVSLFLFVVVLASLFFCALLSLSLSLCAAVTGRAKQEKTNGQAAADDC